uniref:Putative HNH endonuclease n=2 Tax=Ignatiaceae TaxID=2682551 RepID=A0A1W6EGV0_9CHLO|nr:putative HNH endonuclease [Pseudocharacium americanum]YP_009367665.1 putative HNH endonuclease [Ignatius tetrasporus]ARK14632.1 putative HNH endonuclease [Pseudocharacium americanum]ARK14721.1 putative HNH endonuclease [Ignatius tetrasporus]
MNTILVLSSIKIPLMPSHPARARQLIQSGKAKVYRHNPFTIILTERNQGNIQPIECKIDPGSQTTGMALVVQGKKQTKALLGIHLKHRGKHITQALKKRSVSRKFRRSRKTRYRPPRFLNRTRPIGWLPPSINSRLNNITNWVRKLKVWAPLSSIEVENVKFDIQKLQNPEIQGIEYQQGTLMGYEVREYILEKFHKTCAYCGQTKGRLEIDHIIPKSKGGSNRMSNLTLACQRCNQKKGNQSLTEFVKNKQKLEKIKAQCRTSFKDAAIVNSMRKALVSTLKKFHLPVYCWSSGLTKYNRVRQNYEKHHWIDAACVGNSGSNVCLPRNSSVLTITAMGRGNRKKCQMNKYGFPKSKPKQAKRVHGLDTGDWVKIRALSPEQNANRNEKNQITRPVYGRVTVRATGNFAVTPKNGKQVSIMYKYCFLLQKNDGYNYT